ncbi:cadherin-like beta sandwich domain-containing protein [Rhodoferax sp.]|uniref:cadherin-like beta sandwich domain-containing protein n=1 Tax=Rhodoferax sp. TaxID=50421 RepID=UPI0025DDFA66|nr:cadherin-like beta sandwich domain-containing protein [Rhodoferax sp.]MCM2295499.1 cadherin-like beta sandwich domain-containing protein [Rhodoferax sp.]
MTDKTMTASAATTLLKDTEIQQEKLSRRLFGQMLGLPALMASAATATVVTGCGGGDDVPQPNPDAATMTRASFVASISKYFDWVHSSEYNDPYKLPQPTFVDVKFGVTPNAKEIETALEESIVSNVLGYFYPEQQVTREEAAEIYAKAFKIPASSTNALSSFTDVGEVTTSRRANVNALVAAGYMKGSSATQFAPAAALTAGEAKAIFDNITSQLVAPPQVMCKSGTTAPRRYVTITTPTPGAKIYYTYTFDGTEPADPVTSGIEYNFEDHGVLQFVNPLTSTTDFRLYRLKTVAKKSGLVTSAVQTFTWNIVRPRTGAFQAKLVHAATDTSPTVWKINNPAEYFQAFVFYIEGSARGLVFDAGEYGYQKANLKTFIDTIATKPYDIVVGHNHPDHAEQIYNFTSAGIKLYASAIEKAAISASSRADFQSAGALAVAIDDGFQFDLGNVQVTAFIQPGHTNGLVTAIVNQTGWVFGSDNFGCNRAYTADTTQYNGVKVDLFLSLTQQLIANYMKRSVSGQITELTNAHQEVPVGMEGVNNFVKCFQQLIDRGDAASAPSIRGGRLGNPTSPTTRNSRMSMVGDMWRDKNWMAVGNSLGSGLDKPVDYFTTPTTNFPCGATIDYNTADGYKKYSVLSNIEIAGGTLVGVDVYWAAPANGVANKLSNKFDPWTYAYTINVPIGTNSILIKPTAMSNNISSMKVNGTAVSQGSGTSVAVAAGTVITIDVVSPDGSSASSYKLTVAQA